MKSPKLWFGLFAVGMLVGGMMLPKEADVQEYSPRVIYPEGQGPFNMADFVGPPHQHDGPIAKPAGVNIVVD